MNFSYGSYGYIAESDLEEARYNRERPKPCVYYSHQACEKILKQYIQMYFRSEDISGFLHSHKVKKLAVKTGIRELMNYRSALSDMQDYYFDGRYPSDDYVEPTVEDAYRILNVAENVMSFVIAKMDELEMERKNRQTQREGPTEYFGNEEC